MDEGKSVFISIGSNIEPEKNVPACLRILREEFCIKKISPVYETAPFGPSASGKNFWNAAAEITFGENREKLVSQLRMIETRLGRRRDPANKFAPRTIDLDVLPQPGYEITPFIIIPLAEIAPHGRYPKTGETFEALAGKLSWALKDFRKIDSL